MGKVNNGGGGGGGDDDDKRGKNSSEMQIIWLAVLRNHTDIILLVYFYTCILTLSPYTVRLMAFYDITLTTAVKLNVLVVVLLMNFEGNTTVTI